MTVEKDGSIAYLNLPRMDNHISFSTASNELSIIIPAKNEEIRLPKTMIKLNNILKTLSISHEIIVVNDGSTDNTEEVARLLGAKVVNHSQTQGITAAFKTGTRSSNGGIVMLCPADISDFSFFREALKASKQFDVVSISKRHPKSKVVGYTRWRWFISNGYQRIITLMFGDLGTCTDTHYIKFYRGNVVRSILKKSKFDGPVGETELMLHARDSGCTFFEIPAKIIHKKNNSKTSLLLIFKTIIELLKLRIYKTV